MPPGVIPLALRRILVAGPDPATRHRPQTASVARAPRTAKSAIIVLTRDQPALLTRLTASIRAKTEPGTYRLVVVDNRAGQLLGLDAAKGGLRWKTDLDDTPFSSPLAWQGGKGVVLKIGDHKIGAFDTSSGKPIWQYGTEAVVTLPIVSGDNVNVATSTGEVMALD